MSTPRSIRNAIIVIALPGLLTAAAFPGDRHHRRPDVDIESLRGELWRAGGEWLLEVRYDVEVEDYIPPPGELELILYVTEHGRTLVDRAGRPIEFVVPLEYPSEVDDGEIEFEDRVTVTLPDGVFHDPDRLRLESVVFRVGDNRPLDRKDKSIKYDRPKPPRYGSVSIAGGVGTGLIRAEYHHGGTHRRRVVYHRVGVRRPRVSVGPLRIGVGLDRVTIGRHGTRVGRDRLGDGHRIGRVLRNVVARHHRAGTRIRTYR